MTSRDKNVLHWFRNKGLRLHDNPSLIEALKGAKAFRCVYILDPWFATASSEAGVNKWRFLLECLEDLDNSLRKFNSRLFVIRGQPTGIFPKVFKEWNITTLSYEEDPEPFARERDQAISTLAEEANVEVISRISHTLYPLDKIIYANEKQVPHTYRRFQNIVARMPPPDKPVEKVDKDIIGTALTEVGNDHDELYGIPTLKSLGFDTEDLPPAVWKGGEAEALVRLVRHLERKAWVASFEKPKMTANSLLASPTGLSPYLRFGCLSPRHFYWKLTDLYMKIKKQERPTMSLYGQLLWREFFYTAATHNANFDKMVGNQICVQIPWDNKPEALAKWAEGKTGFPWIDAIMMQLRQEGWVHNLARHSAACFLTRGDLWISWEEGAKVFDELLLDGDWSTNAGSWMWLSCSSFFQQFFHSYCPTNFGKATDPEGNYIRKYLPVLKGFPSKYIYEPWTAPPSVQEQAKCTIGKDYPVPMVNHAEASRINMQRMVQVYQQFRNGPLAKRADFKSISGQQYKQGNKLSRIQFKSDTTSKRLSVTQGTKRMHSMGHMNTPGRSHYMCPSQALHGQHSMVQEYKKPRLDQSTGHSFVKDMDPDSSNDF